MNSGGIATMSTIQDVLKNFYIGPIRENLNQATVLLAQMKKSSKEVVGEQVIVPLHIGRNWGVGARGTAGTGVLPTAQAQQYSKTSFTTKDEYGRILISGKTIRATKTDKGAFLRVVESETKGMVNDLGSDINRQMYGNGTGTLATCGTGGTSASVQVVSTQYLEEGMVIDFYSSGTINANTQKTIYTIDSETQFTLSGGAITWTTGDTINLTGVGQTSELNGLDLICNSVLPLENIDPAAVSLWKPNIYGSDSSPAILKEYDMQTCVDAAEKRGGKIKLIITSYEGRAAYMALLVDQKRFTSPQVGKLKGGFSYIDFNDIPLTVDRHCQAVAATTTRMYFLSLDSLAIYRMADFEWAQEDGAILARQVGTGAQEAYEGTLVCDMEFATDARRHNSVLVGVKLS